MAVVGDDPDVRASAGHVTKPPPTARSTIKLDPTRGTRTGIPEVVYAPGKTVSQITSAVAGLLRRGVAPVMVTRCPGDLVDTVAASLPGAAVCDGTLAWRPLPSTGLRVGVVTAGTSDQWVAREAEATLDALGILTIGINDVGIAGIHRLLEHVDDLRHLDAVIVIAGMEGALPTAVAGLIATPIVAVPTSTGYGSSLDGLTAMLAMSASCAPGVSIVGIDNGFGAACVAARWLGARPPRAGDDSDVDAFGRRPHEGDDEA